MRKILISLSISLSLVLLMPAVTFAQSPTTDRVATVKSKADAEIQRRIDSINDLVAKINTLKRLSDSDKTNLINMANSMIANLNSLKSKIDADSDITALRTDRQDIYTQYRVYMLFMPSLRIYVAADRINDTADLMTQVATKLQGRINGNATLQGTLNDATSKISDAQTQATNAVNAIKNLQPDEGNNGVMSSNKQALLNAKGMIMAAVTDLQNARKDFQTILKGLMNQTPTATP